MGWIDLQMFVLKVPSQPAPAPWRTVPNWLGSLGSFWKLLCLFIGFMKGPSFITHHFFEGSWSGLIVD